MSRRSRRQGLRAKALAAWRPSVTPDTLRCAVLLPDEAVLNPWTFLRFHPGGVVDRVSLDPDGLDEDPVRVEVFGPARPPTEAAV